MENISQWLLFLLVSDFSPFLVTESEQRPCALSSRVILYIFFSFYKENLST